MIFNPDLPDQCAAGCIYGVGIGFCVAKVCGKAAGRNSLDRSRASNCSFRVKRPINATGRRIQRVDVAIVGADEYPSANHRGLA